MSIKISIQVEGSNTLLEAALIKQFQEIEILQDHEQNVIIEVVTAYILDFNVKQNYAFLSNRITFYNAFITNVKNK